MSSFAVSGVLQLSVMTSHMTLEAMAAHPNQSPHSERVCKTPIIRALGIVGQMLAVGALLSFAFIPSFLSRDPVGKGFMPVYLVIVAAIVCSAALFALIQEVRSCRREMTSGAVNHRMALRVANVTLLVTALATPLVFALLTGTAISQSGTCPDFLDNSELPLPADQHWPYGCVTIGCFDNIRVTIASRVGTLWVATLTYVALALVIILAAQADVASVRDNDARNAAANMRHALQYISHEARAPLGGAILSLGLLDSAVMNSDFPRANLLISDLNLSLEAAQRQLTDLLLFDSDLGDAEAASVTRWSPLEGAHLARLQSSFAGACQAEKIQLEIATMSSLDAPPAVLNVRHYWSCASPLIRLLQEVQSGGTSGATPASFLSADARASYSGQHISPHHVAAPAPMSNNRTDTTEAAGADARTTSTVEQTERIVSVEPRSRSSGRAADGVIATTSSRRRQSHLTPELVPGARPPTHSHPSVQTSPATTHRTERESAAGQSKERHVSAADAIGLHGASTCIDGTGAAGGSQTSTMAEAPPIATGGIAAARQSSTSSGSVSQIARSRHASKVTDAGLSEPVAVAIRSRKSLSPPPSPASRGEDMITGCDAGASEVIGTTRPPSHGTGTGTGTFGESLATGHGGMDGRVTPSLAPDTEVYADIDRLLAIVTNALSNSIKHVADDGKGKIAVLLSLLPRDAMPGSKPARTPPPERRNGIGHSGIGSAGGDDAMFSTSTTRRRRPVRVNLGGVRSFFSRGPETGSRHSDGRQRSGVADGHTVGDFGQSRGLRSRMSGDSGDGGGLSATKPTICVLEIQVLDNGRGIPPDMLRPGRLFHPFQQLRHDDASRRMTSTGLGLSIVKSVVVEQLNGEIGLASRLDEGTLFFARIPVYARSTVSHGQPSGLPSQAPIDAAGAESAGWAGEPSLLSIERGLAVQRPQHAASDEINAAGREARGPLRNFQRNSRLHVEGAVNETTFGRSSSGNCGSSSLDASTGVGSRPDSSLSPLRQPASFQQRREPTKQAETARASATVPRAATDTAGGAGTPSSDAKPLTTTRPHNESPYGASGVGSASKLSPVHPNTVTMWPIAKTLGSAAHEPTSVGRTQALAACNGSGDGVGEMAIVESTHKLDNSSRTGTAVPVPGAAERSGKSDSTLEMLQTDAGRGERTGERAAGAAGTAPHVLALSVTPNDARISCNASSMESAPVQGETSAVTSPVGPGTTSTKQSAQHERDSRKAARAARRARRQADRSAVGADGADAATEAEGKAVAKPKGRGRDRGKLGIAYVVDDERVNRTLMAKLLRGWGFESVEMVDGKELVAAVQTLVDAEDTDKSHWPVLVTLDIQMPEMDGFMTLAALAQLSWHMHLAGKPELSGLISDLVVLGVTGNAVEADKSRMSRLGARRVLIKPVVPTYLAESVEDFCLIKLPPRAHKRVGVTKGV